MTVPACDGLFLTNLTDNRKDVFRLSFDEVPRLAEPQAVLFESLRHDQPYVPYTDTDHYCFIKTGYDPNIMEVWLLFAGLVNSIPEIFRK